MEYFGIHSTDNIDDGYLGSGIRIKRAIAKYGKDSFTREILEFSESREDLLKLEREVIDREIVESDNTYNIALGGLSTIDSMIEMDDGESFIRFQSESGKKGGKAAYGMKSEEERKEWHKKGAAASHAKRRLTGYGKFNMPDDFGEIMQKAAINRPRYECPICGKMLDGGNFIRHMKGKATHNMDKDEAALILENLKNSNENHSY